MVLSSCDDVARGVFNFWSQYYSKLATFMLRMKSLAKTNVLLYLSCTVPASGFTVTSPYGNISCCHSSTTTTGILRKLFHSTKERHSNSLSLSATKNNGNEDENDNASQGIVTFLTDFVNFFSPEKPDNNNEKLSTISTSFSSKDTTSIPESSSLSVPKTPEELKDIIEKDYTENNYLWTGDIYLPAFAQDCLFQDPTLSFTGRDVFVKNVQNLQPVLRFVGLTNAQSKLLSISSPIGDNKNNDDDDDTNTNEGYIETRWNMIGTFSNLWWKPTIDVIGRTKFRYRRDVDNDDALSVYFYDEVWEMPASEALLQIITPSSFDEGK